MSNKPSDTKPVKASKHGNTVTGNSKQRAPAKANKVDKAGIAKQAGQGLPDLLKRPYRFLTRHPAKISTMRSFLLLFRDQRRAAREMMKLSDDDISILLGRLDKAITLSKPLRNK